MADAIKDAVLAVNAAVKELRNLKNTQKIIENVIKINYVENQANLTTLSSSRFVIANDLLSNFPIFILNEDAAPPPNLILLNCSF